MPGWRLQWNIVFILMGFFAFLGIPRMRRGKPVWLHLVDTGIWQNVIVCAIIGFLIGMSLGGYCGFSFKDKHPWRFSLRGILYFILWTSVLLGLSVYIAKHANI